MFGISNHYIANVLEALNVPLFDGVYSCDNIPLYLLRKKRACFICNLSRVNELGSHFITVFKDDGKMIIFDSLALTNTFFPQELITLFESFNTFYFYQKQLQSNSSHFCGFYCIFFVLMLNVKPVPKLSDFVNPKDNDDICIENILKLIKHNQ